MAGYLQQILDQLDAAGATCEQAQQDIRSGIDQTGSALAASWVGVDPEVSDRLIDELDEALTELRRVADECGERMCAAIAREVGPIQAVLEGRQPGAPTGSSGEEVRSTLNELVEAADDFLAAVGPGLVALAANVYDAAAPTAIQRLLAILARMRITIQEFLGLAAAALGPDNLNGTPRNPLPEGWSAVSADPEALAKLGFTTEDFRPDDRPFRAGLYRGPDGQYVLAFKGTTLSSVREWVDNAWEFVSGRSGDYNAAIALAERVKEKVGPENLMLTGHSRGGGMASIAGAKTGVPTVTFNPAPVSNRRLAREEVTREAAIRNVVAIRVRGEALGTPPLQPQKALGQVLVVEPPPGPAIPVHSHIKRHGMPAVRDAISRHGAPRGDTGRGKERY